MNLAINRPNSRPESVPDEGYNCKMIKERFDAAVNVIRSLPKDGPYQPSHDMMLKFYGLFKQATEGPCTEPKPSFYEVVKGYKWRAWSSLGNMSETEAMCTYVDELKKIVETMSYSDDVAAFIDSVGPFYEYVEIINGKPSDMPLNMNEEKVELDQMTYLQKEKFEVISIEAKGSAKHLDKDVIGKSSPSMDDPDEISPGSAHMNGHATVNGRHFDDELVNGSVNGDLANNGSNGHAIPSMYPADDPIHNNDQVNGEVIENTLKPLKQPKKFICDTEESDEEYSEPAETPELLREKQKPLKANNVPLWQNNSNKETHHWDDFNPDSPDESRVEVMTCGGGDAIDAGRIRFNQGLSFQKGNNDDQRNQGDGNLSQRPPPPIRGGRGEGGGGGRRRKDSEDSRDGRVRASPIDVNSQLILILQKIHQDLEAVVARLDNLETQALRQHQDICSLCQRRLGTGFASEKTSWWPFPELSPRSTFFLLTWPLILHGAVKLLIFLRSKRRRKATF